MVVPRVERGRTEAQWRRAYPLWTIDQYGL